MRLFKRKEKKEIKEKRIVSDKILRFDTEDTRVRELESAMNLLLKEHSVAEKVEDLFIYINHYAHPKELWEDKYCQDYLRKAAYRGYDKYFY